MRNYNNIYLKDYLVGYYVQFDNTKRIVFIDGQTLPYTLFDKFVYGFDNLKHLSDRQLENTKIGFITDKVKGYFDQSLEAIKEKYSKEIIDPNTLYVKNKPKLYSKRGFNLDG